MVPLVSSVGTTAAGGRGRPFLRGVPSILMRLNGFRADGVTVAEKENRGLADLSVPGAAVKSMCLVTGILDSGSVVSRPCQRVWPQLCRPPFPTFRSWAQ